VKMIARPLALGIRSVVLVALLTVSATASAQWAQTGANISNTNPGNVGIGTSTPAYKLDVFSPSIRLGDGGSLNINFNMPAANTFAARFQTNNTDRLTITGAGNVGIGTAFPSYLLHVNGHARMLTTTASANTSGTPIIQANQEDASTGYYLFQGTTGNSSGPFVDRFHVDRTGGAYFGGNVGVGTLAPAARLHIHGPADLTTFPATPFSAMITDSASYSTPNAGAGVSFGGTYNSAGTLAIFGVVSAVKENQVEGNYAGALTFGTRQSDTASGPIERMRIKSTGEVVIAPGAAEPYTTKLTVMGDADIKGNISARYQDLAEWVPATEDLQPGTVVVLNPEARNEVMASAVAYDTRVAGVVSAQPGIILGEAAATSEKIATTGRVKVRVDATKLPVRVGDLLVTSDKPGTAMRSEPMEINGRSFHQPGTIIGKALEPLPSGEGEILVLLSMQ
jgi:hypothetical protein